MTPDQAQALADDPTTLSPPPIQVPWTTLTLVPAAPVPPSAQPGPLQATFTLNIAPDPTTNGIPLTGLLGYSLSPLTGKDTAASKTRQVTAQGLITADPPGQVVTFVQPVTLSPAPDDPTQTVQLTNAFGAPLLLQPTNPGYDTYPVTTS